MVIEKSEPGRIYNIGAGQEHTNMEVTSSILEITGADRNLVRYIEDRPGHDRRYALNVSLIENEIGWKAETDFKEGLRKTVEWYSRNSAWWQEIKSGEFREYYVSMYQDRLTNSRESE